MSWFRRLFGHSNDQEVNDTKTQSGRDRLYGPELYKDEKEQGEEKCSEEAGRAQENIHLAPQNPEARHEVQTFPDNGFYGPKWYRDEKDENQKETSEKAESDGIGNSQEVNDPKTQCDIGNKFFHGKGVNKDYSEAIKWYRRAADQGNSDAQFQLGLMYETGKGVPKDYSEAVKWYRLAANQGHAPAQNNLGALYYTKRSELNQPSWPGMEPGKYALILESRGVVDYPEAVKWLRLAADQGFADAQHNLGDMYYRGHGVQQDYSEALKWFRLAADQGHSEAMTKLQELEQKSTQIELTKATDPETQYNIGDRYFHGKEVEKDYSKALKWFRLAADQGHSDAQFKLGLMFANGLSVKKNYRKAVEWCSLAAKQGHNEAVKWFLEAAKQGNGDASFQLALMYETGEGISKDYSEALEWYNLAAKQGNTDAQFQLGLMYETGKGVYRNYCDALKWFRLAADEGNSDAQYHVGAMYENGHGVLQEDYLEALKWYRLAAEQGHSQAITKLQELERKLTSGDTNPQKFNKSNVKDEVSMPYDPTPQDISEKNDPETQFDIGNTYYYGGGAAPDYNEAVKWYRLAANQGYAIAQCHLGVMYAKGTGVPQDHDEAIKWFQLAADQGNSDAQYYLGIMYANGFGVSQNYSEAIKWFRLAVKQGNSNAQNYLGEMYQNGYGVTQDYSEALKWYRLAANQGYVTAQCNLGVMYANGFGVSQNYNKAIKWFRLPADMGDVIAQYNLGVMYRGGLGVRQDDKEAAKWFRKAADQGFEEAITKLQELEQKLTPKDTVLKKVSNRYDPTPQKLSKKTDTETLHDIGNKHFYGDGVKQDYQKAMKWYRLAANQGNIDAQYSLGTMYMNGQGVKQDYSEAMKWFRLAAEQGFDDAITKLQELERKLTPKDMILQQSNKSVPKKVSKRYGPKPQKLSKESDPKTQFDIGNKYYLGEGVTQDYNEAVKWFRLAAEQGNSDAQFSLGVMYYRGRGVPQDHSEAVRWYRLAADQGNCRAQNNLGHMYETGKGVRKDHSEALKWYRLAADQGHSGAITKFPGFQQLKRNLTPKDTVPQQSNKSEVTQKVPERYDPKSIHLDAKSSDTTLNGIVEELNKLIGLERVKKEIYQLMQVVRIREMKVKKGLKTDVMTLHSVFYGNPGTGKTTVARIYGKMLKALGLLSKGHLVETDRSGLVAGYIGQTEIKTDAKIKEALGGILFIDEAYSLSKGEDSQIDYGNEAISIILKRMEDHRDDFVVIVAGYDSPMEKFLRSNEGLKSRFSRHIHFDDFSADELIEIFQLLCSEGGYEIDPDALESTRTLLSKAYSQRDEGFGNARYVRNLFEDVVRNQNVRLAETIQNPSHKDLVTILPDDIPKGPQVSSESLEELLAQLNKLIGLEQVKSEIYRLTKFVKVQQMRRLKGLSDDPLSLHCVFFGNPGTGKTTVARIYGKLLNALGLLSKGHLVETDRSGLVAGYIGQTENKTDEKIKEALGGILFIDEAYSLFKGDDAGWDFGNDAVSILLKRMEDYRDDFVVIVAGYDRPMEELLESNEGLKSRFSTHIRFPDYSPKELLEIFKLFCKDNHYQVRAAALKLVQHILENEYQNRDETFGNGRLVRNLFERVRKNQAVRIEETLKPPSDKDICAILPEDIQPLIKGPVKATKSNKTILRSVK